MIRTFQMIMRVNHGEKVNLVHVMHGPNSLNCSLAAKRPISVCNCINSLQELILVHAHTDGIAPLVEIL
jgi:hypothetical protein